MMTSLHPNAFKKPQHAPTPMMRLFYKNFRGGWRQPKVNYYRYFNISDKEAFLHSLWKVCAVSVGGGWAD